MSDQAQGRYVQDPVTGKHYFHDGTQWVEVLPSAENPDAPVSMRSARVFAEQRDPHSSDEFLRAEFATPAEQRAMARRQKQLAMMAEQIIRDMVTPSRGPEFRSISDESFQQLMAAGEEVWAAEGFKPLTRYINKLVKKDGTALRPLYRGEVGVVEKLDENGNVVLSYILVLESGKDMGQWTGIGGPTQPSPGATPPALVDQFGRPISTTSGQDSSQ